MTNNGEDDRAVVFSGIGVSPGVVIGRAVLPQSGMAIRRRTIGDAAVAAEQHRFRQAVARAEGALQQVREHFAAVLTDYVAIIDSHILMLRDHLLFDRTLALIAGERTNAEWALEKSLAEVRELFSGMEDAYLRDRFHDVRQVADRIVTELSGAVELPEPAGDATILVARDFTPEAILRLRGGSAGLIAAMGGETSHAAIIARTLGIPAVVGVTDIDVRVADGDMLILDGGSGEVFVNPSPELTTRYRQRQDQLRRDSAEIAAYTHLRAETADGMPVRVEANLESVDEISQAFHFGAVGVGLFRSEYLYLASSLLPDEETLLAEYRRLLSLAAPFPVTIRTLDIGGDKIFPVKAKETMDRGGRNEGREANPALGLRAIRYCLREPTLFITQLRALFRASAHGNLRILFPMISSYCELEQIKEIIAGVRGDLRRQGMPCAEEVRFGIMIEVPSAVAVADTLAGDVDFFSIGTNDLIQYVLAIDRGNEQVAHMYEPLHPAVLRLISQVVRAGHRHGIEVGICGEMAGQERYLPVLLGLGLDAFSMHPPAIPAIKKMIRHSRADEVEELADRLLASQSTMEVRAGLAEYLARHHPELVL
ncbi:MAG: phosphoenolpyruvate--protein phosphotransferase [Thermodesulfobacteriota bacterium]